MLPYGKVQELRDQRVGQFVSARARAEARRRDARNEPGGLSELLNALAQGLVGIGIPGNRGRGFPAGPAY